MTSLLRRVSLATFCALALPLLAQEQTTTIGGYGNAVFRATTPHVIAGGKDTTGAASDQATIDRFVLFVSHSFSEDVAFKSELEVEDTKLVGGESGGEVSVEQMYLDFSISKCFNARAGLVLVPLSIINEFHEPPTYNGNSRPQFANEDGGIIPTTWRDLGAGAYGEIANGWNYRAYIMASLNGANFSHDGGIGEGKYEGRESNMKNLAVTGKVEYSGTKGLRAGAGFFYGGTSGGDRAAYGSDADGIFAIPMSVVAVDAQYITGDLYLRGEWAMTSLSADKINKAYHADSLGHLVDPVASGMGGFYLEAAYNVMPVLCAKSTGQVLPFVRYENINLNSSLAAGETQDDGLVKTAITAGLTYKPVYNVAVKFDWQNYTNKAFANTVEGATSTNQLSLGIGYMF